jgi:hypothetical protein
LELSFCGSDFGKYEGYHFNTNIYRDIAYAFCQSLDEYYEPTQTKFKRAMDELENISKNPRADDNYNKYSSLYAGTPVTPTTQEIRPPNTQRKITVWNPRNPGRPPPRNMRCLRKRGTTTTTNLKRNELITALLRPSFCLFLSI